MAETATQTVQGRITAKTATDGKKPTVLLVETTLWLALFAEGIGPGGTRCIVDDVPIYNGGA